MEASDAIDGVRADDGQVRHVDRLLAIVVNEGHAVATLNVAGEGGHHVVKMAAIDLVDNHKVAGQHALEESHGPAGKIVSECQGEILEDR